MSAATRIKAIIRPLIPDRVMARYRLVQHSRQVRTNVDVVVTDPRERRRWLGSTPDTYRVVEPSGLLDTTEPVRDVEAFGPVSNQAVRLLGLPDAEVGVVARVSTPAIVARMRREPATDPIGIAASTEVIAEVGGPPVGVAPLPGLLDRLRDAGRRITVEPVGGIGRVDLRREDPITAPSVVILSAVPMYDVGGGSRAAQFALEFVRRGHHVTYVALYGSQESVDLGLRFIHPRLEQARAEVFDPEHLAGRVAEPGLVIVEIPASDYRSAIGVLQGAAWTVVYDVIDDWSDSALGGSWYDASTEAWFARTADHVTASAPDLADQMQRLGLAVTLMPNAVNTELFGVMSRDDPPPDLPAGDGPVLGYVGSLYGTWFDWAALERVAIAFPGARVLLIGDDKAGHPAMPDNVAFLGLKAQTDLPPYVQRFDVGLLPFAVTETTHAVSPLKVYEYLASGVPVAAPPLRALDGLEGVFVDSDLPEAVRRALGGKGADPGIVAARHSWQARVAALAGLVGREPMQQNDPVKTVLRPVVHYAKDERVVKT